MNKKSVMDINNCDILNENGVLRLVYNFNKYTPPMIMVRAKSYHEFNKSGMFLFGAKTWATYIVQLNIDEEEPILRGLLADIYQNYHDLYEEVFHGAAEDDDTPDCDCEDCCDDGGIIDYLTLTDTGRMSEKGHHIGRFDFDNLAKLDTDTLHILANVCDIKNSEAMTRGILLLNLHNQDIDIDDHCYCDDDTDDDEDDINECDGDCDNCEFVELDDRDEENDESCACEEDEHPDWPHPIKDDTNTQPEAQQYEYVNGPAHYHGTECIENMRKLFGDEAVRWFCICNAYKYRFRDGSKPGVAAEQDEDKARWYEDYAVKMMGEQRYY